MWIQTRPSQILPLGFGMLNRKLVVYSGGAYAANERSFSAFDPVTKKNNYGIKPHPSFEFKFTINFYSLITGTTENNHVHFIVGIFYEYNHFSEIGQAEKDFLLYDENETKRLPVNSMGVGRCQFASCKYGDDVYVCGGKYFIQ